MAKMIPAFIDDKSPLGERDVFNRLAAGPDTWMVMHALDLAPWNRGLRTEIDFVIIMPNAGILCVEVKSHENLTFDGVRWYPSEIKRSPFKQAADGRYTFYRRLRDIAPQYASIPIVHCCIFPRSVFRLPPNLSIQPWELMDSQDFQACGSADSFCAALQNRVSRSIDADRSLSPLTDNLSSVDMQHIVEICVPIQKRRPAAREEIIRREEQMNNVLREQQKPVLDLAKYNNRIITSGGAGTGKTLIAMELARRMSEQGRRVGLLCFNQLIGEWIKQQVSLSETALPNLIVGRAVQVMAEMTEVDIPSNPPQDFWEDKLPKRIEERITNPEFEFDALFDYLVIDEAQDILARPHLWQCLGQFLDGGFTRGDFALFGDFDHQVLTGRETMLQTLALLNDSSHPTHWMLTENCRNYRIIGDTAIILGGLHANVYSGYLRNGGSIRNFDISYYENDLEQIGQLEQWLREFHSQGYKPSEITILSFHADEASAAVRLSKRGWDLKSVRRAGNATSYASVHAFKGMENKIIILTDVILTGRDFTRDLFYTGLTRATECSRVLCDKASQDRLFEWLTKR